MALGKLHATGCLVAVAIIALVLLNLYFLSSQKDYDVFFETQETISRGARGAVPKYLILVLSKRGNVERRQAIRETWAREYLQNFGWKTRFVVGTDTREQNLDEERFEDVLEVSVPEGYLSLTEKLQKAFETILQNERFQYVIKVDDDVYLNLRPLLEASDSDPPDGSVLGHAIFGSVASSDPVDKYFSEAHASQKLEFPAFASGTGYLMSRKTLAAITRKCTVPRSKTQYEDVYFTGYCRNALGFHLVDDKHFGFQRRLVLPCNVRQFAVVHNLTAGNLRYVHEMLELKMSC
uniref:Hexosyltransferase n=1 Tax=Steinernema glaseri TaxID=37863 RepID=A0A1I7YH33_9BILA